MAANKKKIVIALHPKQVQAVNDPAKFLLLSGGVGSGKTIALIAKVLKLILEHPGIIIIITAETLPQLKDTTMREFFNFVPPEVIVKHNKTTNTVTTFNGSEVLFRVFDDPKKIRSYTAGCIVIEEMTQVKEELFDESRKRLRQKGMPNILFGATNPGPFSSWVWKRFIGPITNSDGKVILDENGQEMHDPKFKVIYSRSQDNKSLDKEYIEDLESIKLSNPEAYNRMVEGHWGTLAGRVYDLPDTQRIKLSTNSEDYERVIAAVDFGHKHPTAILIDGINGERHNIFDETYRYKLVSSEIIDICKQKVQDYGVEVFYCDYSRPEIIEDMRNAGLNAVNANKAVFDGIMYVKSLIGEQNLFINRDCTYTLREFDAYIWKTDDSSKSGDRSQESPVKANDDCMDALRYLLYTDAKANADTFEMVMIGPSGNRHY